MNDRGLNVLDQYDLKVRNTRRGRGAMICETDQGIRLLKEVSASPKRVEILGQLLNAMKNKGYTFVDTFVKNREEEYISKDKDGTGYLMKEWFEGRECDVKNEQEVLAATRNLAKLHKIMTFPDSDIEGLSGCTSISVKDSYVRHNKELKKVKNYIGGKRRKTEFEICFTSCFRQFYEEALKVTERLEESTYDVLKEDAIRNCRICHGEYNHHNILFTDEGIATTNFEKFSIDIQISDFYDFLRKIMEKNNWNRKLGMMMLDSYSSILPISNAQMYYLGLRLSYPEKFWKVANHYFNTNKAWIPGKNVEKLEAVCKQWKLRESFLNSLF